MTDPKLIITPDGDTKAEPDFQGWDKTAPTRSPNPRQRNVKPGFEDVVKFIEGLVMDEGLVLDICFERACDIVETNLQRTQVGIDFFIESNVPPAIHAAGMAAPLAVSLYGEVLKSMNTPENAAKLMELVEAARKK